jgi:PKD repeat protein
MNNSDGPAPLSVQFTDLSANTDSWSWDFESDGKIDSTEENPVHLFTTIGTYTVTLSATNKNGTDSKTAAVIVTHPVENGSWNNTTEDSEAGENVTGEDGSTGNITKVVEAGGNGTYNSQTADSGITNAELDSQPGSKASDLNGENAGEINSSSVEYALENKTDAPGFEIVYEIISLLAVFLYKKVKPGN